ncbi:MAG: hypothetical protein ABJR23_09185 [Paracoccaceae bacterium]
MLEPAVRGRLVKGKRLLVYPLKQFRPGLPTRLKLTLTTSSIHTVQQTYIAFFAEHSTTNVEQPLPLFNAGVHLNNFELCAGCFISIQPDPKKH